MTFGNYRNSKNEQKKLRSWDDCVSRVSGHVRLVVWVNSCASIIVCSQKFAYCTRFAK